MENFYQRDLAKEHGFSVLELIVVMAIAAVVMSVVGLQINRSIEGAKERSIFSGLKQSVTAARLTAIRQQKDVVLRAKWEQSEQTRPENDPNITLVELVVPDGWSASGEIKILAWGTCEKSEISIRGPQGRETIFSVSGSKCDLIRSNG